MLNVTFLVIYGWQHHQDQRVDLWPQEWESSDCLLISVHPMLPWTRSSFFELPHAQTPLHALQADCLPVCLLFNIHTHQIMLKKKKTKLKHKDHVIDLKNKHDLINKNNNRGQLAGKGEEGLCKLFRITKPLRIHTYNNKYQKNRSQSIIPTREGKIWLGNLVFIYGLGGNASRVEYLGCKCGTSYADKVSSCFSCKCFCKKCFPSSRRPEKQYSFARLVRLTTTTKNHKKIKECFFC